MQLLMDLEGIGARLQSLATETRCDQLTLLIGSYDGAPATPSRLRGLRRDLCNWRLSVQAGNSDALSAVIAALCKAKLALDGWVPVKVEKAERVPGAESKAFGNWHFYTAIGRTVMDLSEALQELAAPDEASGEEETLELSDE